jgi:spore germination protein GerM
MNHRLGAVLAAVATAVGVTACGVSSDSGPRDVRSDERPAAALTPELGTPRPGTGSTVYFLGPAGPGEHAPLVATSRAGADDPTAVLMALLEGPTLDEQGAEGLRTAIPAGTMLRSASLEGTGTLRVDVSTGLLSTGGDVLLDALAQIVFTAIELQGVDRVRLLVDGEAQDWPTSSGDSTRDPLTMFDFADRVPFEQPDYPALPSPTTLAVPATTTP